MTLLGRAREAIESLDDANPYDPGDVETALDGVASTLSRALLKRRWFSSLRTAPSLEDVLEELEDRGWDVSKAEEALREIRKILDENAYPDEEEIEDASEMEEHLGELREALLPLVKDG